MYIIFYSQFLQIHLCGSDSKNFVNWCCLNCGHIFAVNFIELEGMRKEKGYYCPKCRGTENQLMNQIDLNLKLQGGATLKCENTAMTVKEV